MARPQQSFLRSRETVIEWMEREDVVLNCCDMRAMVGGEPWDVYTIPATQRDIPIGPGMSFSFNYAGAAFMGFFRQPAVIVEKTKAKALALLGLDEFSTEEEVEAVNEEVRQLRIRKLGREVEKE
jgi:hypothetical protein